MKKVLKNVLIVSVVIIGSILLIYLDFENVITKLGLSPSLWGSMVVGVFPIILTIVLWQKERNERIEQIKEDSKFQKKLIIRTQYIEYFEELLEQINGFIIFLEVYILKDENLIGEKVKLENKINSLIGAIYIENKRKVWQLDYKVYAFKAIDIDIFSYNYNGEKLNMRAYMPYIILTNELNTIYKGEEFSVWRINS